MWYNFYPILNTQYCELENEINLYHCSISKNSSDLIGSLQNIMKTTTKPRLYLLAAIDNTIKI